MSDIERYDYAFDPEGDAWAARLLRRVPHGASVLELGPGPGAMTQVLRARGQAVTVVENDPAALQALQALGVEVVQADLDGAAWLDALQGQRFGAILACDVLEHLRQPQTAVGCYPALFRRAIGEAEYGLALVEAVAHLNCLLRRGLVSRSLGADGAILWQAR